MNGLTDSESAVARQFPTGFLWGASTSSYQIEGAVNEDGRGQSIWDEFCRVPGAIHAGDTGDIACDSYHRMQEDIRLLRELGLSAYRFSISWARVLPDGRRQVNQAGLDYYRALAAALREAGVVPVATVYHWELPQAVEDAGGWPRRDTAERFGEYAGVVAEALGDQVGMWVTINEPLQTVHQGYRVGTHAPGRSDVALAAAATHHVLLGHGLAVGAIRAAVGRAAPVGCALDLNVTRPAGDGAEAAALRIDAEQNRMYVDPVLHGSYPAEARTSMLPPEEVIRDGDLEVVSVPLDFLGVNYYRTHYVRLGDWSDLRRGESPVADWPGLVHYFPPELPRTVMDWNVEPDGLYDVLMRLRVEAPDLPLYITENGYAGDDYVNPEGEINDYERVSYVYGHLEAAWRAIRDGVKLRGYFHWSLMDNFEWAWGYQRRFGLYFVDFATQRRLPKRSAAFYSHVVRLGELPARGEVPALMDGRNGSPGAVLVSGGGGKRVAHGSS